MTPILEDSILGSDLDFRQFNLLNVGNIDPLPPNLVLSSDPRLSDPRMPLPGSVTDASVALGAGISQAKILFDGVIPPGWLGAASNTAAQGDLAEYLANKGVPNGYAGLDAGGKVPVAQLPAAVGTGTVISVGLSLPTDFNVAGSPITGAGTFVVTWADAPAPSWFGNASAVPATPQFNVLPLPGALIPNLDASVITTGILDAARIPPAVGLGVTHAAGAVPDPGDGSGGALATDYLARDMSYRPAPTIGPTYQPTIPNPTFNVSPNLTGPIQVVIQDSITDAVLFYSLTSAVTGFQEFILGTSVTLAPSATIWAYAAHPGYNNSNVVNMTNTNP